MSIKRYTTYNGGRCLNCYQWINFVSNWRFCPYCGVQWEGEVEESERVKIRGSLQRSYVHSYDWLIESAAYSFVHGEHKNWEEWYRISGMYSAEYVLSQLKKHREEDMDATWAAQYRARLVPSDQIWKPCSISKCWTV